MATAQQIAASGLYANIMAEIKIRISAIDSGTGGLLSLPPAIITEFCFLQLRMICELIALGCLTAHGDISKTEKLQKRWEADKIMEELERLHPQFFPVPITRGTAPDGHILFTSKPDCLNKKGLLELYYECGRFLHRGSAKNLLKPYMPIQVNFPDITSRAQKIVDLLAVHVVHMLGGEMNFICTLHNASDNMKVNVAIAEATDLPPPPLKGRSPPPR